MRLIIPLINLELDFFLKTDASFVRVGAVLKQYFGETKLEHPLSFFRRALTSTERYYSVYDLEMFAVVRTVEHFRVYLFSLELLLRLDHATLDNLLKRNLLLTKRV